jgi:hypothetical protein
MLHPKNLGLLQPRLQRLHIGSSLNKHLFFSGLLLYRAPLRKNVPLQSYQNGVAYWEDLYRASFDVDLANSHTASGSGTEASAEWLLMIRPLRRRSSWKSTYNLTWYQERYLRQFLNASPLLD